MLYFMLILSSIITISIDCSIYFNYSKTGIIGKDLSISNELKESLSVGWYGEIKYVSEQDTTLNSKNEIKAEKRDGGTMDGNNKKPG